METENAQNEGRTREMVDEDKEIDENILSTEDVLSTDKEGVSTDMEKVSTDRPIVSTDGSKVSTDRKIEGTDEQVEGTEEHNEGTEEKTKVLKRKCEGTKENFEVTLAHKVSEAIGNRPPTNKHQEESKEEVQKESKEEESTKKRKLGTRKKIKSRKRRYIQNTSKDDIDKENDELRLHLTIVPDEEKEADYEILDRKYPIKEWKTECLGIKPQTDQTEDFEKINQNVGD
ncbi:hypothetical protein Tco_0757003 [Tanacetum coccineum]